MPLAPDTHLDEIAEKAVGFVGADLALLCRGALRIPHCVVRYPGRVPKR